MPTVDKGLNDKSKGQIVQDSEVSYILSKFLSFRYHPTIDIYLFR